MCAVSKSPFSFRFFHQNPVCVMTQAGVSNSVVATARHLTVRYPSLQHVWLVPFLLTIYLETDV